VTARLHSMTAYGVGASDAGSCRVTARCRSVNHRFLDVVVRLPEELRHLEIDLRQRVSEKLSRGRVDLRVDVDDRRERTVEVVVNRSWLKALDDASRSLAGEGIEVGRLHLGDLLRAPEALRVVSALPEGEDELPFWIAQAVDAAVEQLIESRAVEGGKLEEVLTSLLDSLASETEEMSELQDLVRGELEKRLRSRLEELAATGVSVPDEVRVAQEITMLIDRSDVREELDRLRVHQAHFRETMAQAGAVGKKLDFLTQEMARELTTLATKCRNTSVMQRALDAKVICEQIREQVQNIE